MTTPTFIQLLEALSTSVDKINLELIDHVTNEDMDYRNACIKPNITSDFYYNSLKKEWENQVNLFTNDSKKCSSATSKILSLLNVSDLSKIDLEKLSGDKIEELIIDNLIEKILTPKRHLVFNVDADLTKTLLALISVLKDNFFCQIFDIYIYVMDKYRDKLKSKLESLDRVEIRNIIVEKLNEVKQALRNTNENTMIGGKIALQNDLVNKLTGIYDFSVENELNRLIPEELGSLKTFFVRIVSTYYNKLHPIVWAQILKHMIDNIFIETPSTPDEIFQFASKYLLLYSGPFILKMLQMIKPVLTEDLLQKYNLKKLTYPKLTCNEVNTILNKVVLNWDMYKIKRNMSASVGHVCIVYRVDNPKDVFVLKIVKPLSIVQSCWEYKTLSKIFNQSNEVCENHFVKNMLESNGRELNVANEISNINIGNKYYNAIYSSVFSKNVNAKLSTIKVKNGIIKENTWFALGMTLAPGIPLSDLTEKNLLENDTIFRAKIHRCLDLFVYKFFNVLITKGFYHGDPHAGNIFFSFADNQMTLIDFGATGSIDLFGSDPSIRALLEIIVMSTFYNYDAILDKMTDLVNSKCGDKMIDKNSEAYIEFKNIMVEFKNINFLNHDAEGKKLKKAEKHLFSEKRISDEQTYETEHVKHDQLVLNSIYSILDYELYERDPIVFNDKILENNEKESTKKINSIPFSKILEKLIQFYASSGTNVAIKFSEFYELQKAYGLLIGVLNKTNYSSYRISIMTKKAIFDLKNAIPALTNVWTTTELVKIYLREKQISSGYKKIIINNESRLVPGLSLEKERSTVNLANKLSVVNNTKANHNQSILQPIKANVNTYKNINKYTSGKDNLF